MLTSGTDGLPERSRDQAAQADNQFLRAARLVQLSLAAIVVIVAFVIAPADRGGQQQERLANQSKRVAEFAEVAADALATLEGQPLDTGFEGTDRGDLFARGGPNYEERSIVDAVVELGLLDADEAREFEANGIRMLSVQCAGRVGVLGTSDVEVPEERREWWEDNACDAGVVPFLEWPIYLALSGEADGAP